jgi:hypothetical protein
VELKVDNNVSVAHTTAIFMDEVLKMDAVSSSETLVCANKSDLKLST